MKKIGVVTLHNVVNYGSVLQAYALQETIKKLGRDSTIIDFYPERLHALGMLKRLKNKSKKLRNPFVNFAAKCIIFPSYIKRFHIFKNFSKKHLKLTSKRYCKEEEFDSEVFSFDAYCTGSDQVWNSSWNEGIVKPYYLTFTNKPKFAYAASFGKSEISKEEQKEIQPYLRDYFKISVREQSGVDILNEMNLEGENVLDPTLLLNGEEWGKLASSKYEGKKYIFMYNLNRNKKMWEIAKEVSKKHKIKLIYLSYSYHEIFKYGKMACNKKVEHFLSLIKNATCVFTDSFHACAFSLNFNKNLYVIYPEKFSTRVQNILEKTNLTNRVINSSDQVDLNDEINYEIVNQLISVDREKSIEYLKDCLNQIDKEN